MDDICCAVLTNSKKHHYPIILKNLDLSLIISLFSTSSRDKTTHREREVSLIMSLPHYEMSRFVGQYYGVICRLYTGYTASSMILAEQEQLTYSAP